MKSIRPLFVLAAWLLLATSCRDDSTKFIFFTDTHFPDSEMDQPALFEPICREEGVPYVIWGGDGVSRYASPDSAWAQQYAIEEQISRFARIYNVRGNHDFSRRVRPGVEEQVGTLSQVETAERMRSFRSPDAVSNAADPGACYYYFDDLSARVRFLVLDTHDRVRDENAPMATELSVGEVQTDWVCRQAIGTLPSGWSLLVFSHAPVWWDNYKAHFKESLSRIRQAASEKGAPILAWFSGHIHRDTQLAQEGQWEITTYCYTPTFPRVMMFDTEPSDREGDHRPCFDVVTLTKGHRELRCRRVGAGHSRIFHLDPVELRVGESKKLRPGIKQAADWRCLDAYGSSIHHEKWQYPCEVASFDTESRKVTGVAPGEAMVVAISKDGTRESFLIRVFPSDSSSAD